MPAHEFVRRLKVHADESDRHYTFWLGAGCSVTSGIPAAAELVREQWLPRLHRLKGRQDLPVDGWAQETFPTYDQRNLASLYGPVMDALFHLKEDRQRETERLCEKGVPGFGYAVLAALMSRADGAFSAALTTNFDDLVADSMYVYGEKRPLVIQHDALSGFVRPGRVRRPLVVKVHGDHRLNPMHTSIETAELERGIRKGVHGLLHDRGVIFMGYAGNDRGVLEALEELPDAAIPLGVWWVSRREPTSAIRNWLDARNATWVQVDGFDELMLLIRDEFEITHPTADKFERMIERYRETYESLGMRVEDLPVTAPDSEALKEAARNARDTAEDWWKVELEARQFIESDPARADKIYKDGVERIADWRLFHNYAFFLQNEIKDLDRAEELYKRGIEIGPERPSIIGGYALFLAEKRRDPDRAEEYYKRAIEIDPDNANNLGNYGLLLAYDRKDPDRAEEYFRRAIEADPSHANNLSNYGLFLADHRNDLDQAEEYFRRAIEADPDHAGALGNYAVFLAYDRNDSDQAEEYFRRAIEADSDRASIFGNYGLFLADHRKDPDQAEKYYKRAIKLDPHYANALGNYAVLLVDYRNAPDRAEEYFKRALDAGLGRGYDLGKSHANNLGNYGRLLLEKRKDAEAWNVIEQALDRTVEDPLKAELCFYSFALGGEERAAGAFADLTRLVQAGVRSPDWDFSRIVARAEEDGRQDLDWLRLLSDVIADRADVDVLDQWPAWRSQLDEGA